MKQIQNFYSCTITTNLKKVKPDNKAYKFKNKKNYNSRLQFGMGLCILKKADNLYPH
jgi:hypothetical protein